MGGEVGEPPPRTISSYMMVWEIPHNFRGAMEIACILLLVHSGPMHCFEAPLKIGQVSSFATNFLTQIFVIDQSRLAFHFFEKAPPLFYLFFIFPHDFLRYHNIKET
jgi:hypothetical protein